MLHGMLKFSGITMLYRWCVAPHGQGAQKPEHARRRSAMRDRHAVPDTTIAVWLPRARNFETRPYRSQSPVPSHVVWQNKSPYRLPLRALGPATLRMAKGDPSIADAIPLIEASLSAFPRS